MLLRFVSHGLRRAAAVAMLAILLAVLPAAPAVASPAGADSPTQLVGRLLDGLADFGFARLWRADADAYPHLDPNGIAAAPAPSPGTGTAQAVDHDGDAVPHLDPNG